MNVKEFAGRLFAGLEKEYWGDIDPNLFKYISEDVKLSEVDEETMQSIISLRKILEEALSNKSVAIPIAVAASMSHVEALSIEVDSKITARDVIAELRMAWKDFGKYTYQDKGADDVIDVDTLASRIRNDHDATGIIKLLKEVAKVKDSDLLITSIIHSYDHDDDLWEALEAVDDEFIGEYY